MKIYLETQEVRPPDDPIDPEHVRIEVTENTALERVLILAALRDVMSSGTGVPPVVL